MTITTSNSSRVNPRTELLREFLEQYSIFDLSTKVTILTCINVINAIRDNNMLLSPMLLKAKSIQELLKSDFSLENMRIKKWT
jgi:hypothetical protein